MPVLSENQVLALAPDDGSAKTARELAQSCKWISLGKSDIAVWGECKGSGALPYQTCVDICQLAFKCSCPSRKLPCKHGLGLLLLLAANQIEKQVLPDWAEPWLQSRHNKPEAKSKQKDEAIESTPDPIAKAKRQADRQTKVESGLSEFSLWMQDRMRQGFAGLETQSYQFWEGPAARLTDAQVSGLARQLRQCAGIPSSGEGWQARLLQRLALMHLATEGFCNIAALPEGLQQDLRSVIGFTVSQDEVLKGEGITDRWQIYGQRIELNDRLKIQRTWLMGEASGKRALVLDFAHGRQALDLSLLPGSVVETELVYYQAAFKLRALVKRRAESPVALESFNAYKNAYKNAGHFQNDYACALAVNPWLESFPLAVENVVACKDSIGKFMIVDSEKSILPLEITDSVEWQILALTGGHPFSLFGEWNGETLLPLSICASGNFARVDERLVVDVT